MNGTRYRKSGRNCAPKFSSVQKKKQNIGFIGDNYTTEGLLSHHNRLKK
jgi:hypothetical protein